MSLIIKGMEMPKNEPLLVKINPDGSVSTTARNSYRKYEANHIPPHGDLIDRDEYRDKFMNGVYALCSDDSDNYRANAIIDLFDDAPTIISASGGQEDG